MIGLRELLIIGMVVLVLYGRTGVLKSRQAKTIMPWLSPVRRTTRRLNPEPRSASVSGRTAGISGAFLTRGNRFYWFVTILAATAVAALDHRPDPYPEGVSSRSLTVTPRGLPPRKNQVNSRGCGRRARSPAT